MPEILSAEWTHRRYLGDDEYIPHGVDIEAFLLVLNKLTDPGARLYYLRATAQIGSTRNVLLNQIKLGAYERTVTEKKSHNFALTLPEHLTEQAEEMLKSSYNLEFLGIHRETIAPKGLCQEP